MNVWLSDLDLPQATDRCIRDGRRAFQSFELETDRGFRFWVPLCVQCTGYMTEELSK